MHWSPARIYTIIILRYCFPDKCFLVMVSDNNITNIKIPQATAAAIYHKKANMDCEISIDVF